jgi:hypothetical protein
MKQAAPLLVTAAVFAVGLSVQACRIESGSGSASLGNQEAKTEVKAEVKHPTKAECAVTGIKERGASVAEDLDGAKIRGLSGVSVKLPQYGAAEGDAKIVFTGSEALADKAIAEGLDLYDRQENPVQVTGGLFKPDYSPVLTARVFFDWKANDGKSGFAELSLYDGAKIVEASATLSCIWSE